MNSAFASLMGWIQFITVTRVPRHVAVRDWSVYYYFFFKKKIKWKKYKKK